MADLDQKLAEASAEIRSLAAGLNGASRRRSIRGGSGGPRVAVAAALVAVVLIAGPVLLLRGRDGGSGRLAGEVTTTDASTSTTTTIAGEPAGPVVGEPVLLQTPFDVWTMHADGTVLYATAAGPTDRVLRSTDGGSSWKQILEADPGDSEGLFAVGDLVVLVVEDDHPTRGTEGPSSVVTQAPWVLIYDPATGSASETVLPRPDDPVMEGLGEEEGAARCGTFGYQSLIGAEDVAVGERLLVTGSHTLVGRLEDGTVLCPDEVRRIAWTSDDGGRSWEFHDAQPAVHAAAWSGSRFVAWSSTNGSVDGVVVSADGLDWAMAAASPPVPSDLIPIGFSIVSSGDTVVAAAGMYGWAAQIPDDVTDPEQLRDVLRIPDDADVGERLAMLGVDLPLDPDEVETIARFNASVGSAGAVVGVSHDGGLSWTITYVPSGVSEKIGITATGLISQVREIGDPSTPSDDVNALFTSVDGMSWDLALELPGLVPLGLVGTPEAVFVGSPETGGIWRIPVGRQLR